MDICPECKEEIRSNDVDTYVREDEDVAYHTGCYTDKDWLAWRKKVNKRRGE